MRLSLSFFLFLCFFVAGPSFAQIPPDSTIITKDSITKPVPLGPFAVQFPIRMVTYHEIQLVAGRNSGSYQERMQSIDKLNAIELGQLPARSVPEVLSFTAGVDVRQRGLSGTQADIGIRGGNFEQGLLLVNGFKMSDPQTGHHAANLPIPLIAVSEIQVFKSPTVLQFGQSSLTGAVHIGAYSSGPFEVKTSAYGGSFNSYGAQALVRMKIKKYQQLLALARDQSEGHWYNSDFKNHQIFYTGSHAIGQNQKHRSQPVHRLTYLAAYTDRNFGANGFYSNKFPDQWEQTRLAMAGIKHNININSSSLFLHQQLLVRSHADEFRLKRYDPSFYTNTHVSNVLSYELQGTYFFNRQRLDLGVEERLEQLNSSNLGLRERQYQSAFTQIKGQFSVYTYAAGILVFTYDWQNPQVMPSLQLGRSLQNRQYLFANYSRGNRVPSWTEMYYADPSNVGNPNLQPEYSHAAELGWRQTPKYDDGTRVSYQAAAALFYRQHTNMIDWVRDSSLIAPNPNPWQPVNIANVAFSGVEASLQFNFKHKTTWGPSKLNLNYTYIQAQHNFSAAQESRYAITSLRHQLNAIALFDLSERVQFNLTYRLVQRIDQPLYQVIDAKVLASFKTKFSVFVEANNLTNTQYVEAGYVQMPGRWFKLGLQFNHKAIEEPKP